MDSTAVSPELSPELSPDLTPDVPVARPVVPARGGAEAVRPAAAHLLRRPVFDDALALTGYELLVGGVGVTERSGAEAVVAALQEVPASVLAGGGLLFVSLPRPFLLG